MFKLTLDQDRRKRKNAAREYNVAHERYNLWAAKEKYETFIKYSKVLDADQKKKAFKMNWINE